MIWVHSVGQVPLAFLLMVAAFKSMDPSLEESAMMSGANTWQTFRRVTLRLLMPTAGSVVLILFVLLVIGGFVIATPGGGIMPISQWQITALGLVILVPTVLVALTLVRRQALVPSQLRAP